MTFEANRKANVIVVSILVLILVGAAVAWFGLDPGFRSDTIRATNAPESIPSDEFDRRVRDYILNNPEVILEAVQRLQQRQRNAQASDMHAIIAARAEEIFWDPDSPVGGNPEGDVAIVEFFDYNCPYCRRVAPVMDEAEAADPDLRIVYKEYPILGPNSIFATRAALAARKQGKYVPFHKALMQANRVVDEGTVIEVATGVGIDITRLRADMEDPAVRAAVERNLQLARDLRITGTPSFVVGNEIVRGATDLTTLQALVARARSQD